MPELTERQMVIHINNVACGLESNSKRSMRELACERRAHF